MATYPLWRRWCLTWGATGDEADGPLPGDELLAKPAIVTTRAVLVDAPPEAIWPWLVQMGPGRGGAYTYDWIENLFGLGMHSADTILPEFQDLKAGDAQRLGARGPVLRVAVLEPRRALVLRSDDEHWVWAFALVAGRRGHQADQPEPDRGASRAGGDQAGLRVRHGTRQPHHGAQDAARHQGARGTTPARRLITRPRDVDI